MKNVRFYNTNPLVIREKSVTFVVLNQKKPHMGKISHFTDKNQEFSENFYFPSVNNFKLEATTDAMDLSSHGGLLLLQREEEHLALASQLASCIKDTRTPYLVRHSLEEIIMTRIFQICLGYEDVNDCDRMRRDPMMQLAVDTGALDKELCSSATMCRFENMVTDEDLLRVQEMFLTMFILSYGGKAPGHIILDCDDTNVDTYGNQQLTLFNAYYDSYCYMPLMVFEGYTGRMILPLLKPGRKNKAVSFEDTILWLIACLREVWPNTIITVRGDSHFCSHELMDWACLNDRRVFIITGLARNNVLENHPVTKEDVERVRHDYELFHHPVRTYGEFRYKAGTWTLQQRVVVKAEYTEKGELNVRFIVTNIRNIDKQSLYENTYCGRGCDELFIRQFKEGVNGDRLSCHTFKANRLRIFIHAAAYMLLHSLRERALRGTSLEKASILTVREKLLLYAVSVRKLKTKVIIDFAKRHPMIEELRHCLHYYSDGHPS